MYLGHLQGRIMTRHNATVIRVTDGGVVYAEVAAQKLAGFPFGKIKGYHGESAQELRQRGLKTGGNVVIEYDDKDSIQSVSLMAM